MFTSRAEYRLQLREDNADSRLTEGGRRLGLVDDGRWEVYSRKQELVSRETSRLASTRIPAPGRVGSERSQTRSLLALLQRPGVTYDTAVASADPGAAVSREALRTEAGRELANQVIEQIETSARYAGYVDKQRSDVARASRAGSTLIPDDLDFGSIRALSFEARQSLTAHRPASIGAAARLPGMTPAAMSLLLVHVKKQRRADSIVGAREPSRADS